MKLNNVKKLVVVLMCFFLLGNIAYAEEDFSKNLTTNLTELTVVSGTWKSSEQGVLGDNKDVGDSFVMSNIKMDTGAEFEYSADIALDGTASGIVFEKKIRQNQQTYGIQ